MRLAFRQRVFLGLVGLGTLPLAAALFVLAVQVRSTASATGPRAALDEVAESGRALMTAVDTLALDAAGRNAIRAHTDTIARRTSMARRAETLSRYAAGALGLVILVVAVVLIAASLGLARRWSRYVSAPIEELVRWVRLVERRQPLPADAESGHAPEFAALRNALREMDAALDRVRHQELEQVRLHAFRETARRVAHEMRGPLTATQLAIRQLAAVAPPSHAIEVVADETQRLERMAKEFAEFGRLPEGPAAPIDVAELLASVIGATVPEGCPVTERITPGLSIHGRYEPIRRAVQNVVQNAVDATDQRGIEVESGLAPADDGTAVRIVVRDHGPGIPEQDRHRVFEPYVTSKHLGTGLGLAMVRQTVSAHGGTIVVGETAAGGAEFTIQFPVGA